MQRSGDGRNGRRPAFRRRKSAGFRGERSGQPVSPTGGAEDPLSSAAPVGFPSAVRLGPFQARSNTMHTS